MSDGLDTTPAISTEERAKRKRGIDFARGSVRLEGFILDDQTEALFARYVDGDLDSPGLTAAILRYCGIAQATDSEEAP